VLISHLKSLKFLFEITFYASINVQGLHIYISLSSVMTENLVVGGQRN